MAIRLLRRSEIADSQWNRFVSQSPQRIVYAYTWYLDVVSPNWAALVAEEAGNWTAVMPLPLRRKFGFEVIQQPLFCQLLGVFGSESVDFLTQLPFFYRYASLYTGRFSAAVSLPKCYQTARCQTHLLRLNRPYEAICAGYSRDRHANLKIAQKAGWQQEESEDLRPIIDLFRQNHSSQIEGGVSGNAYLLLADLVTALRKKNAVHLHYALKDGQIEAGALFVIYDQRIIYLFNAASELGRKKNARTWLIDNILHEYANQDFVFDFESPERPSIAAFYESFGAAPESYLQFRYNQLPFPLKQWQEWRKFKVQSLKFKVLSLKCRV